MDLTKVHKVQKQWHYPIMTKFGFKPENVTAAGVVRGYEYTHPNGYRISCHTGVRSDYWHDHSQGELPADKQPRNSLWGTLEAYLGNLEEAGHI